jgi:hypothetical protein
VQSVAVHIVDWVSDSKKKSKKITTTHERFQRQRIAAGLEQVRRQVFITTFFTSNKSWSVVATVVAIVALPPAAGTNTPKQGRWL